MLFFKSAAKVLKKNDICKIIREKMKKNRRIICINEKKAVILQRE